MTVLQRLEGSAYRDGRLVCERVAVTVVADAPSARHVRVRFIDAVDQHLRSDLQRLIARRGAFAARLAELLDPVEIVGRDAKGALRWRLVGRLERPAAQYWPPTDTEFWLRESTEPTTLSDATRPGPGDGRSHRAGKPATRPTMTSAQSAPRLSATEIRALRRAAQRQLTRWAKLAPDTDTQQRSTDLRHALHTLRMFRDGCELHPTDREHRRDPP